MWEVKYFSRPRLGYKYVVFHLFLKLPLISVSDLPAHPPADVLIQMLSEYSTHSCDWAVSSGWWTQSSPKFHPRLPSLFLPQRRSHPPGRLIWSLLVASGGNRSCGARLLLLLLFFWCPPSWSRWVDAHDLRCCGDLGVCGFQLQPSTWSEETWKKRSIFPWPCPAACICWKTSKSKDTFPS